MDFKDLYQKIREMDQQVPECGEMENTPPMPTMVNDAPPPNMSVNLNAQGLDNIESLMKLLTKVNPDMMPKDDLPMPKLSAPSMIKLPIEKDGMDDEHEKDMEAVGDANVMEPDPEYGDMSDAIPDGNDMHKSKKGYAAAAGGDNPRAVESQDVYSSIKEGLLSALAQYKKS